MRISDWSSDVCSSDLAYDEMSPWRWGGTPFTHGCFPTPDGRARMLPIKQVAPAEPLARWPMTLNTGRYRDQDRKSVVEGKSVSVRVALGGRRIIKKKRIKEKCLIRHVIIIQDTKMEHAQNDMS